MRLAYNLGTKQISFLKDVNTFVYLNNLNIILWRKNKSGLDPDFVGSTSNLVSPPARTIAIGLSANF
jgi:hypothetical protein